MTEKKKIFVIADHPFAPSGVGTQTRYVIETLLKSGRYKFICFGGAVKHENYQPQKTQEWGDDLVVFPVNGYGTQEMVRSILWNEKPDALWFMTDPRFYGWLWDMENEIRSQIPMIYYHVWDNYPYPKFNKNYYLSNDLIATISKVTDDIVKTVAPEIESVYLPHSVNTEIFAPYDDNLINNTISTNFKVEKRFRVFWNNRNARRKMSGSVLWWFNEWAEKVGPENVQLIMHTDPKDPNGQDLEQIIHEIGATDGRILISNNRAVSPTDLAIFYNVCDCTVNIADAEGFGLATLESLACGTPIIVNMTGGLQEQVRDEEGNWFGVGIEPSSRTVIGSQEVPYIYEDRISKEDFHHALTTIYVMPKEQRKQWGFLGRQHVLKNYNFENFQKKWIDVFDNTLEKHGSWKNRKNYQSWELREITP